MKRLLLIIGFLLATLTLRAQVAEGTLWQHYLEQWAEQNEQESLPEELLELIDECRQHPINLNDTLSSRILQLPFVSEFQWEIVKAYILQNGQLYSANELRLMNGFDSITIGLLMPLVEAVPVEYRKLPSFREMLTGGRHQLLLLSRTVLPRSKGYEDSTYLGSPYRMGFRYSYKYGHYLHLQLSGEKDPGEEFFAGTQRQGFDHYGGFLMLNEMGIVSRAIAGHYNLQFGQGLTLWSGFAPWGSFGANQKRYGQGIRTPGSMTETGYLQGLAATIRVAPHTQLTSFYSYKNLDAIGATDSTAQSIYSSGYHRSALECSKRGLLNEQLFGFNIHYQKGSLSLGMTGYHSFFDKEIVPQTYYYNHQAFRGSGNTVGGLDAAYRYRRLTLFAEASASANPYISQLVSEGGDLPLAAIAGLQFEISGNHHIGLSQRYYSTTYQNLHASPFGQGSDGQNESGTCLTWQSQLPGGVLLDASFDICRFPLPRYGVYAPSSGNEARLRLIRTLKENGTLSFQYQFRNQEKNASRTGMDSTFMDRWHPTYFVEQLQTHRLQLRYDYQLTPSLGLSSRAYFSYTACEFHPSNKGWFLLQDFRYSPAMARRPLTLTARYSYFRISSYDARIYAMESDLLYEYSTPAFNGNGHRCYLIARWGLSPSIIFSAKYGLTAYTDRSEIGSGHDVTEGPLRHEFKAQLLFNF